MNAAAWLFLFLLVGALLYLMVSRAGVRARKQKRRSSHGAPSEISRLPMRAYKYRAVELQLCDDPCESALALAGRRLLKSEAPALPLSGCHYKNCLCAYTQYDDRRILRREDRRLLQRRIESSPYGRPTDRRLSEERRKVLRDRRGRGSN
jgi:hypothetical protein